MVVYRSKIGPELAVPISLLLGLAIVLFAGLQNWPALLLMVATALFVVYVFRSIQYRIDGGKLVVRAGFLVRTEIDIASISSIQPTRDPMSAPAASLDRLRIRYGSGKSVLVSPDDRDAFLAALFAIHPGIAWRDRRPST